MDGRKTRSSDAGSAATTSCFYSVWCSRVAIQRFFAREAYGQVSADFTYGQITVLTLPEPSRRTRLVMYARTTPFPVTSPFRRTVSRRNDEWD